MRFAFCFIAVVAMSSAAMSQQRVDGEAIARGILEGLAKGLSGGGDRISGKPGGSGSFSNGHNHRSSEVLMYVKFVPTGKPQGVFYRDIGPLVAKQGVGYFPHKNARYNHVYTVSQREHAKLLSRIFQNPYWSKSRFGSGYSEPMGTTSRSPLVIEVRQADIPVLGPRKRVNPLGHGGGSASRFKRDTENSARDAGKQLDQFFRNPFGN